MASKNVSDTYTYIVGDIHGCYEELLKLEEDIRTHAKLNKKNYHIVSVGDLIDRGSQSLEVVTHFRLGTEKGTHSAVAGNHEASFFETLEFSAPNIFESLVDSLGGTSYPCYVLNLKQRFKKSDAERIMSFDDYIERMRESWLTQGGKETLHSFGCVNAEEPSSWRIPIEDTLYLFQLPLIWENESVVVTHALATQSECNYARSLQSTGQFDPLSDAHMQNVEGLTWRRRPPFEAADSKRLHISGHTPTQNPAELKKIRSLQIDTGCVYGNKLTAFCENTNEFLTTTAGLSRSTQ